MLHALELDAAELSLLLCDDVTIHQLNREHRGKNRPTDVLAFAMREGRPLGSGDALLGDVVISLPTAQRQAREHRHSLWDEVTMLLAHGLLHLIGYDHRTDAEECAMNRQVAWLCTAATQSAAKGTVSRVDKRSRGIGSAPGRGLRKGSRA